jgi:ABC-type nitrate/sulfonate/bicarbonate transport system permease component
MSRTTAESVNKPFRRVHRTDGTKTLHMLRQRIDPLALLGVAVVLAAWECASRFVPASILPSPQGVMRRMVDDFWVARELTYYGLANTGLLGSLIYSATNVLIAVSLGSVFGCLIGLVAARSRRLGPLVQPIMVTLGTVPTLVIAPFFLIWFGVGRASSVLLVLLYCVVTLYLFARRAADNLDPVYENYARTLGSSHRGVIRDVLVPGTVPEVLGGIRIALAASWGIEAVVELLGAQQGIGKIVSVLAQSIDIEGIFAALMTLGWVAVAFDMFAAWAIRSLTPWSAVSSRR